MDSIWYEGERNAMLGIFPTTYVEIIPQDAVASQVLLFQRTNEISVPPGEHPLQERAKHGWSGKGKVQLHRTNTDGGFFPKR